MENQFTHNPANDYRSNLTNHSLTNHSHDASAVSWAAIFAGAAAAAALSLVLLILGTGLGFSAVSAWSGKGISGTTFSVSTIVWVTLMSVVASAIGGYIAGRLRNRWLATAADEVYFRDTAHGFLAWAVATLATATLLTSVVTAIVGAGAETGTNIIDSATSTATAVASANKNTSDENEAQTGGMNSGLTSYFTDMLFRKDATAAATGTTTAPGVEPEPGSDAAKAEVARIYINAIATGALATEDARYAAQVVAQSTGLSQQDAERRVTDVFKLLQTKLRDAETATRDAAEKARKATAYGSLWLFVSLLAGAFIASVCAIFGGRQRDL